MNVLSGGLACALVFLHLLLNRMRTIDCLPNGRSDGRKPSEKKEIEFFHSHRNRRYTGLIPVRDRISNAICSYEVITDINFQRIPNKIDRVICKTEDCKVIGNTDYKCAQLYAQLNVTYPKENCRMEFEVMNIEYACICARSIGSTHITVHLSHGSFRSNLAHFGFTAGSKCVFCNDPADSVEHAMWTCPCAAALRRSPGYSERRDGLDLESPTQKSSHGPSIQGVPAALSIKNDARQ